ncbi:MAG: hypothetical protein Q7U53_07465 [Anaerolineaceae bacterium]|nr:hypothetical protein [Anaerolineaceae bacterium]
MKKQAALLLVICMLFSAFSLAFIAQPDLSMQDKVCTWQKVGETPNTTVSGSALDATASLNGSSVTVSYKGLVVVHTWTAPPSVLTPGEELYFEVSTVWDQDTSYSQNSVGGLDTYLNFNFVDRVSARRKTINFKTEPSGAVENSITWSVPGGSKEGATMEIIGFGDSAVAGGSVRYKYEYQCVVPTPMETETPIPSATPEETATPIPTETPIVCEEQTEEDKLQKILALYYERIPKGIASSGEKNNILDFLGYEGYDEFACGGYQSKVLAFLNSLKFSKDPCEQALVEKWEYGPIQAWWGGHQAVILYPWATNWMETGIVLDPWITQFPADYKVKDWAIHFSVAGLAGEAGRAVDWTVDGSFIGIGPSEVYRDTAAYPLFNGDYIEPGMQGLTKEENAFIKTLPEAKQALFKKLSKQQQKYWLSLRLDGKDSAQQVQADCPLVLYVTDADGLRSGIASDGVYHELEDVLFNVFPLQDGTTYTELIYPLDAGYSLVMEGTGDGQAIVLVQDWVDFERDGQGVSLYQLSVTEGALYESMVAKESFVWQGGSIQPELYELGSEVAWIDQLPGLAQVGDQPGSNALPNWLPGWRVLFLGGFVGLMLGLAGFVVLGVLLVPGLMASRKANFNRQQNTHKTRWVVAVIILIISCLVMMCSAASLYSGITGR